MNKFLRHLEIRPRAVALVIAVPLLVVVFHWLALAQRPAHLRQIVAELGAVGRFMGDPLPNHAGTKLLFTQTTEKGYGVFLFDLAAGTRKLVFEQTTGAGSGSLEEILLGWSPDDQRFAYGRHSEQWELVVADGTTGNNIAVMAVDHPLVSAAWLTPQSLVVADSACLLYLAQPTADGQWPRPRLFRCFWNRANPLLGIAVDGLTRLNDHTVVWLQVHSDAWWKCSPDSPFPVLVRNQNLCAGVQLTTATMDLGIANSGYAFYEQGYNAAAPDTGLPPPGTLLTNALQPEVVYVMAPDYTTNNAVMIDALLKQATLVPVQPLACAKLSFLVAGGNGRPVIRYTIHHADGTTSAGSFTAEEWFSGQPAAFKAKGRVDVSGRGVHGYGLETGDPKGPKLYAVEVSLPHANSAITSMDFDYGSGPGHGAILAVSGLQGGTFQPMAVTGYNADIIVEKDGGRKKSASLAQAVRRERLGVDETITTATMDLGLVNGEFTFYEQGYNVANPLTGLPPSGARLTNQAAPDHVYVMPASYTVNNAVLIDATQPQGTLTLAQPMAGSKLSFLASAGNGATVIDCAVHHADGTTNFGQFTIPDWFAGEHPAFIAGGRVSVSGQGFDKVNQDVPRLYSADVAVANTSSPVTQIDLAYRSGNGHGAIFAVSVSSGGAFQPVAVAGFNADMIVEKTANPKKFYAANTFNGEPHALWRYDDSPDSPQCVVPNTEQPPQYAKYSRMERGTVTNAAGETLDYYLFTPPPSKLSGKPPLVVGFLDVDEKGSDWNANREVMANCGAYFVTVDHNRRAPSQWAEDALTVYRALIQRLAIDTNNVYLYGSSAGTWPLYTLFRAEPELWKGAILFSPSAGTPSADWLRGKKLFFDCGDGNGYLAEAKRFQAKMAQLGQPMTLLVHPGLRFAFQSPPVERERIREAMIFMRNP